MPGRSVANKHSGWYFKDYFDQPSRATIGTVVAVLEVGAFISSLLVGRVGDMIGRRRTILYGSIVFFVGGAFQTFATGIPMMMVGRVIAGLGVGALSTIVPVYQSEISVLPSSCFLIFYFRYADQNTASSQPWQTCLH
jgi:MFS family permease